MIETVMIETIPTLHHAAELEALLEEANRSPFLGDISYGELQQLMAAASIRFTYVDGALAGFGAWERIDAAWDEVGPFYMLKAYRGRGLGKQIIVDVITHRQAAGRNLYAITRNPSVKGMLEGQGFRRVRGQQLPLPVGLHAVRKLRMRKLWQFVRKPSPGPMVHLLLRTHRNRDATHD